MNAIPFLIPYQGIPTDVYLEKNFKLVMDAWRQVNIAILNSNAVIAFGSKDSKTIFKVYRFRLNRQVIVGYLDGLSMKTSSTIKTKKANGSPLTKPRALLL